MTFARLRKPVPPDPCPRRFHTNGPARAGFSATVPNWEESYGFGTGRSGSYACGGGSMSSSRPFAWMILVVLLAALVLPISTAYAHCDPGLGSCDTGGSWSGSGASSVVQAHHRVTVRCTGNGIPPSCSVRASYSGVTLASCSASNLLALSVSCEETRTIEGLVPYSARLTCSVQNNGSLLLPGGSYQCAQ